MALRAGDLAIFIAAFFASVHFAAGWPLRILGPQRGATDVYVARSNQSVQGIVSAAKQRAGLPPAVCPCLRLVDKDGAEVREHAEIEDLAPNSSLQAVCSAGATAACSCAKLPPFRGEPVLKKNQFHSERLGSCAIVGASGAKTSRPYGRDIDAHDIVVRMNEAKAGGRYASIVGTKTSIRVGNGVALQTAAKEHAGILFFPGWKRNWPWLEHARDNICNQHNIKGARFCFQPSEEFLVYMSALVAGRANMHLRINATPTGTPSAGFIAIMSLLNVCDRVDVYAFRMCSKDDPGAVLSVESFGTGSASQQRDMMRARKKTPEEYSGYFTKHYYCHYNVRDATDTGFIKKTPAHYFTVEHGILADLEACGLLKHWK